MACGVGVVRLDSFVRFCRMGVSRKGGFLGVGEMGWVLWSCMHIGRGLASYIVVKEIEIEGVWVFPWFHVGWVFPSASLVSLYAWVGVFAGSCA